MWNFIEVANVGQDFGQWYAQVTLEHADGTRESPIISFGGEQPTTGRINIEGRRLALQRNLMVATPAQGDSITREDFFSRFTNAEISLIYKAAQNNEELFAYVKKLEINPTVNKKNVDVINGLWLLEVVGLLGTGRANEILDVVVDSPLAEPTQQGE